MPFDNRGKFSRLHSWENDRINNIDIVSDRHDAEDDNFAEGLNLCLLRNGNATMEADLKMGNFQIKGLADGSANNDAVNYAQLNGVNLSAVHLSGAENISGAKTFEALAAFSAGLNISGNSSCSADFDISGVLTAVTQGNDDNSNKVATTGFVKNIISSYISGSGNYVKVAVGGVNSPLIIQWGYQGTDEGSTTFPTPFTTADYGLSGIENNTGHEINNQVRSKTTTGFTSARACYYIAIGY